MTPETTIPPTIARCRVFGPVLLVIGAILLALSLANGITGFFESYLFAWVFWMNITLGCLMWVMLINATRSTWGYSVLRPFEAGTKLLPVMFLLFLPVLIAGLPFLYPWADASLVSHDPVLMHRASWNTPVWFAFRTVVYFIIWWLFASLLIGSSRRQDETGSGREERWRFNLSPPGIVIYVVTVTLAATDWVMSLSPHWFSTIFGLIFADGQALGSVALIVLFVCLDTRSAPYSNVVTRADTRDWGNLMLTFTMVWAYFAVSQWIIIWSGNLPEEISFYLHRLSGGLLPMGTFIIAFQFFVPFTLLLSSRAKRTPILLAGIALLVLTVRVVETFWIVTPFFPDHQGRLVVTVGDVGAFLAIGGIWLTVFALLLGKSIMFPRYSLIRREVVHA